MARKIVFVTKDKGGYEVSFPLAEELKRRGNEISIMAEGVSVAQWGAAGYTVDFVGSFDFQREPYAVDVKAELTRLGAELVISTMGSPINLEAKCGQAANELGIPLVIMEDVWGTSRRMPCSADMAFTLDSYGENLMRELPRFQKTEIIIMGNAALNSFQVPSVMKAHMELLRAKFGTVVMFAGEGDGTTELLALTLLSLDASGQPYAFIPRFHPKYLDIPQNRALWEGVVAEFFMKTTRGIVYTGFDASTDSRALAAMADVTVSGSSTALLYAAKHGRAAVSISTALTRRLLGEQVAYDKYPGIKLGIAVELNMPCDLIALARDAAPVIRRNAEHVFRSIPIDEVADSVLSLV
ncbi:MAG: hypothetical protein RDU25_04500 [Patescibacteria group bacterium]|nr:hypothetical protein [Patescibacteria group bacterium]